MFRMGIDIVRSKLRRPGMACIGGGGGVATAGLPARSQNTGWFP